MTKEEINLLRQGLGTYNKDVLTKYFYSPVIKFLARDEAKYKSAITRCGITDFRKIPTKEDMLDIILKLYLNEEIATGYIADLSETDRVIITRAVWNGGLNKAELEVLFEKKVLCSVQKWSSYYSTELIPEVKSAWGEYITVIEPNGFYGEPAEKMSRTDLLLSLPMTLRKLLSNQLPKPDGYYFAPIPEPGNPFNLHLTESNIFGELPRLLSYHAQGNLKYSVKGNPNPASAKKMSKVLKLVEFGPEPEYPIRSLLLAGLLSDNFKMTTISDLPQKILGKLFATDFYQKQPAPYMLTHLKGLNYFNYFDYERGTTDTILNVFRQLPMQEWISFDNLQSFVRSRFLNILPLSEWHFKNKIQAEYETIDNGNLRGWTASLNSGNITQFVWTPYLAGHVYLLAAFGLMDIAVNPAIKNYTTAYDNLYAFRLTKLGAYLLGLTKEYTPPENNNPTTLSFDEASLIIRIEGDIELGDTLLANYATKVSENRYQFSPGRFLKECKSTKDIQNKIVLFKQTIGQKLPPFWEDYLKELINNSKSITNQNNFQVYTIPPENKALQRIIAQDDVLRKLVIKAERYHILVQDTQVSAFINRMKELGYVLG